MIEWSKTTNRSETNAQRFDISSNLTKIPVRNLSTCGSHCFSKEVPLLFSLELVLLTLSDLWVCGFPSLIIDRYTILDIMDQDIELNVIALNTLCFHLNRSGQQFLFSEYRCDPITHVIIGCSQIVGYFIFELDHMDLVQLLSAGKQIFPVVIFTGHLKPNEVGTIVKPNVIFKLFLIPTGGIDI